MPPIPETFHDDMERHLRDLASKLTNAANTVQEIARKGDRYLPEERAKLVAAAKAIGVHLKACPICTAYLGNAGP